MKNLVKISVFSVLCVLVWAFISCEVGLGDSVDVNPPTLVIDYPPVASVVRDEFILSGTCEDDGEVASVQVSVIDGNNVPVGEPRKAEIKDGRWTAALGKNNGSSWELPDGKYTFSVVAEDGAGRKSDKLERTLEIDNTAPVFIVKNPGTIKKDSPASYGSAFKVIGLMAEDHEVSKMIVKVYDEAGSVKEWTEEAVETAGGTEVTFASYNKDAGAENELNSRYLSIYDEKIGGDQNFSCTITVMDSAKKYRTPESGGPSDDNGNTSDAHFLYDDVYTDLMGKTSDYGLTVSEIKQILNGTYSQGTAAASDEGDASRAAAPIDDAKVKEVLEKLEKYLTDTSQNEKRLQFKLNKDANPTWEIMGYASSVSGDSIDFSDNTGSKGGKITFKASYGLDETYFYPNTLKVYLFGPYDPNNPKDAVNKAKKVEIYDDPDKYYTNAIENAKKIYTGSNEELLAAEAKAWLLFDGSTDEAYKDAPSASETSISLPPLPTITAGRQYLFAASGHDMDELDFRPSADCYAFIGVASGTPPTITVTSPSKNSTPVKKDGSLVISGTANGRGSTIEKIWYETTVYDEGSGNKEVGTVSGTVETLNGKDDGSWSFDIRTGTQKPKDGYASCMPVDNVMYKYSTVVYIQNAAGLKSQDNVDVRIDSKNPEPRITSVTPIAQAAKDADSLEVVNGTITISASVADANIKKSVLTISNGTDTPVEADKEEQTFFEHTFDTTCFADETDLTITLTSTDSAGNEASVSKKVHISQKTDRPEVASETDHTLSSDKIAPNKNLFGVTSNNIFKATVTDDDGIGYLQLNVKKASDGNSVAGYPKDLSSDAAGKTSYSLSDKLPEQEGKYTVEITVRDNQYADNLIDTVKKFRSNSYIYNIGIDAANPKLEFTTTNRANTAADTDKQVLGVAKDTSGIKSIKGYNVKENSDVGETGDLMNWWEKDGTNNTITVTNENDTTGYTSVTWEDTIASSILAKGSNRRRYIVEDIYSNTTTLDFIYYVDNVPPEILKVEGISAGGIINGGQIFLVKGTVSDKDNNGKPQEISSVRWKVLKAEGSVPVSGDKYDAADSWEACSIGAAMNSDKSWNWSAAINLADNTAYPDGEYVLCLAAFDAAGNQSKAVATAADNKPATQIAFANDKTPPSFGDITKTETADPSNTTTGSSISAKGTVEISGTVTESNLEKLEVKQVSSGKTTVNEVTVGDDGSWTYTISAPGNYSVSFTAKDKAGSSTPTGSCTIEIDDIVPQVKLDPTNTGFTDTDFAGGNKYLNSTEFMLRVLVNDTGADGNGYSSGIKSVKAVVDGKDTELSTTGALRGEDGSSDATTKNWTLYTGTIENLSESPHTVKISVTDTVGNTAESPEYTFTVDLTAPTLTIDEYASPSNAASVITGTVNDTTKFQKLMVDVTQNNKRSSTGLSTSKMSAQITPASDDTWTYSGFVTGDTTKEMSTTLVFTAYDCAGNTTQQTAEVVFDNWRPDILIPDDFKLTGWSGSDTVSLKVLVTSDAVDLSGIDSVTASYTDASGTLRTESLSTNGVRVDKDGKNSTSGEYCIWSGSLANFKDGITHFKIKAADKAGNEVEQEVSCKVDTVNPEITAATATPSAVNNTLMQSESFSLNVSITAMDKPKTDSVANVSGIKSYSIKKGADIVVPETELSATDGNYNSSETISTTIPKGKIENGTNIYSVYVKDAAGRESAAYTLTVSADIKAPVVKIVSPKVGSTVNKKITISGTIEDDGIINVSKNTSENGVTYAPPKLEVSKDETTWKPVTVEGYTAEDKKTNISWSGTFDTTEFYTDSNPSGKLYVRMTAYDEAGNKGESAVTEIMVNQDTDRPVLRFTAMNDFTGKWSTSTGVVAGSIVDDDKADGTVVKGLWYIDAGAYNASQLPTVGDNNGWTLVEVDDAGNWEISIGGNEAQGVRTWHFSVIDNADSTFCNTLETANALRCPYFQYRTDEGTKTNRKDGITFTVDTKAPTADIAVARGADNITPPEDSADSTVWQTTDGAKFGPNQGGYLWIRVTVNENVGMPEWTAAEKPVVLKISGVDAGTTYVKTDTADSANPPAATYMYYFAKELSSLTTDGTLSVSAEVQDNSMLKAKAERRIIIDTDAPTVSIISPAASIADKVLGAVTIRGVATDTNFVSTVLKLDWAIPKKGLEATAQTWKEIPDIPASGNYELAFTNSAAGEEGILWYVQDDQVADYDVVEVTTISSEDEWAKEMKNAGYPLGNYAGCFKVPVWFRVTDAVGNVGYVKDTFIVVDRDGGKPLVSINTPEEGAIVSGTVTIYGTATDDISVKDVRLQIDANNDGMFDSTDYDHLVLYPDIYPPVNGEKSVSGDTPRTEQNAWYLLADGTNSWKLTIPTSKIAPGGNGTLRVRAMAFDYDGNTRGWSEVRTADIDANAPQIKNLRVVQYGLNVDAKHGQTYKPVSERAYEAGMYISDASVTTNGQWYLTGEVTDDDGSDDNKGSVGRISFDRLTSSTVSTIDLGLSDITDIPDGTPSYILNIPLITTASGQIYYKITANDNSSGTTTQVITINIDSTAPSLYNTDGTRKNDSSALDNALRLTSGGNPIGAANLVQNSNLLFTLGDDVVEDGSGLHSVAFWFERVKSGASHLYDPMKKSGTSDSIPIEADSAAGKVYLNDDGLPALCFTGATRGSGENAEYVLTLPDEIDIKHIRPRGMIKIAGTYCTIDKAGVNGRTITFTPPISTAFTDGELILAQVVDYMGTEANKDGKEDNGDGDGMIETIDMAGSTYAWKASFDSANIPDGPVTIHVTAMDKAGNVTTGSIATQVSNNRPRIAKVLIGTDLNNNGTFDYNSAMSLHTADGKKAPATSGKAFGEFSYYSALGEKNEAQSKVTLVPVQGGKSFKVRDGLIIVPEFVGGNGSELKYAWKDSAQTEPTKASDSAGSFSALTDKTAAAAKCRNLGTSYIADEIGGFGAIVLTEDTEGILKLSGEKTLSITFWDETEETTQGTDSQWALLNIPLEFSTTDTNKPSAKIKPFYWKAVDASGTKVIESSVPKDTDGNKLGHIELEGDLPSSFTAGGTGVYDRDPKVSGQIKLEGTVYDDWLLGSVSVTFGTLISNQTLATYTGGAWTQGSLPMGVKSFKISDTEISQDGHTASWTLVLNTEEISTKAALNVPFSIVATDKKGGNASTPDMAVSAADDNGQKWIGGKYQMDVVPYVREIKTSLSEFSRGAPSVYARTARGHYPVRAGDEIELIGWNLGSAPSVKLGSTSLGTGTTLEIPTTVSSGSLAVSVNSVPALNNENANNAGMTAENTSPSYGYNRQPNGVNNNTLTDDLEIDVWEFKVAAKPVNGKARNVTMKISPTTGRPGFSYANAVLFFNMPAYASDKQDGADKVDFNRPGTIGEVYSQIPVLQNYGGFSYNSFCFASDGKPYGAALCTDTSDPTASAFFQFVSQEQPMPTHWWRQNMNYNNATNASRLDMTTMEIGSGKWMTDIDRIQSISMDSRKEGDTTYIYMAYYDSIVKQVRFRWGTIGSDSAAIDGYPSTGLSKIKDESAKNANAYGLDDICKMDGEYGKATGIAWNALDFAQRPGASDKHVHDSYRTYSRSMTTNSPKNSGIPIQIVAATGLGDDSVYEPYRYSQNYGAGQYVALSMVEKKAFVTWYDATTRCLRMSFNEDPTTKTVWSAGVEIDKNGGVNVKTVADGDGGIHIAYYDNTHGSDLKYVYRAPDGTISEPIIVDSYGAVGAKPTIDVVKENNRWIPYIGYQMNAYLGTPLAAKMAHYVGKNNVASEGARNDLYTGEWEISIVPTEKIPNDDLINIGLWHDGNGSAKSFGTRNEIQVSFVSQKVTADGYAVGDASVVTGNNTANPIIGYGIDSGEIEVAQKK